MTQRKLKSYKDRHNLALEKGIISRGSLERKRDLLKTRGGRAAHLVKALTEVLGS